MSLESAKERAAACWTSRACVVLVQILLLFKGPGITIADCGTDIANTIHLSNHCILPSFHRNTWEVDWDPCKNACNNTKDTGLNMTGNATARLNCTEVRDPDPIWAAWSIWFFFAPGWILAFYLCLSRYFSGFAIHRKYPLSKIQVVSIAFSLLGTSLRVLEYDMIAENGEEEKAKKPFWWKLRTPVLFLFYLLSNIARSFSLCLLLLYCQGYAVIPVLLNSAIIFLMIKYKGGDIASCFLFSVNNFFICSNGGPDDIEEKAHRLMATTSLICLTNFTAWQFGSMYYAYSNEEYHHHLNKWYNYDGKQIDFGEFGIANQAWVCGSVLVLNLFHFLILRVLNDVGWLPKTGYELDMMKNTSSRKEQMKPKSIE